MIIINSAAYVNTEFVNEIGLVPPCFLPLGNKKLLYHQVVSLRKFFNEEDIYVSLPRSYKLSVYEKELIETLNIQPVFIPENLSLGMALLYLLNTIIFDDTVVRLLHGDTLLFDFPCDNDVIALSLSDENYKWEKEDSLFGQKNIWCGYFSFSSVKHFVQSLALTEGDFVKAVRAYREKYNSSFFKTTQWLDFGHINTYFKSRAAMTTQRAFNSLKIENGIVWKSGFPCIKIQAESEWFQNIPFIMRKYTPQLLGFGLNEKGEPYYKLEYLPYLPLNELFVNGRNPIEFWNKILRQVFNFMNEARKSLPKGNSSLLKKIEVDALNLYKNKTYDRLHAYSESIELELDSLTKYDGVELPSINSIVHDCINQSIKQQMFPAILHGDLCFSNILFESRADTIKVIDPRGLNFSQELTVYGDQKYDLAKICHSLIGLYDFIISDQFSIINSEKLGYKIIFSNDKRIDNIQEAFLESSFLPKYRTVEIIPLTILLFISMIPLHFDKPERQRAMLINSLRLYKEYVF